MQQELSRQQQQQQPSRQYMPQQQHAAGGSWQQPGGVQVLPWAAAASQPLSGRILPDADFAGFMQHPNARVVFSGAPAAMQQHNAQQWLHQPHSLQAMQQMPQVQQLAQGQQQGLNLPPPPPAQQQQQQLVSALQQQQVLVEQHRHSGILQQVQQQQQLLFGRQLPAGQHRDPGPVGAAAGAAAGGASGGTLSAAAAAGAAAVARACSADAASASGLLQHVQGAAAAVSGSVRRRALELCFLPAHRQPGSNPGAQSTQQFQLTTQEQTQQLAPQQLLMPGGFSLLQEFELAGSRAFDLDVEGTLLTVAEVSGGGVPPPMAISRLRRVS